MIVSRYHYHTRKTLALFDTDVIIHKSVWFNVYLYIIVCFLSHVGLNLRYSTPFNIYSIKYDNENDDRSDRCNYVYVNALTFKFLYSTKLSLHPQKMQQNLVIGENIIVWILKSLTLLYPDAQDLLLFILMVVNMHSMNLVSRFPPFNINEAVIFLLRENVE